MTGMTRRPSGRPSRKQREKRAYQLTLATGAAAVATVVVLVLAIIDAASFGTAFLLALLTAAGGYAVKRTVRG